MFFLIVDPGEGGPFGEDGNPVLQGNFWIPVRRSAGAGMTSVEIYAGVIFESPSPQFSGLTLILKKLVKPQKSSIIFSTREKTWPERFI